MILEYKYLRALETGRLILRKPLISDADDLREWLGSEEVYTYWGRPANKGEINPELMFIDPRPHVKRKPSHDFVWGIELKESSKVIGLLEVFDVQNDRYGKIAYRIAPQLWSRGICTEAMERVVDFIYTETALDRLEATVDVRNIGSNRVMEKCGFILEGTVRHGKMVNRFCDYHIYGLLKDDFIRANAKN